MWLKYSFKKANLELEWSNCMPVELICTPIFSSEKLGLILELRVPRGRERRGAGELGKLSQAGQPPPPFQLCLSPAANLFSCCPSPFKVIDSRYHSAATPIMLLPFDPCISGNLPRTASWTSGPILLILRNPASHLILAQHLAFLLQGSDSISSVLHTHSCRAPTPSPASDVLRIPAVWLQGKITLRQSTHAL